MQITTSYVRCVSQVALLGAITSNLRAVTVAMLDKELMLNFYYENEPTENEIDLSQVASTEVLSDFSNVMVREQQIILPQPERISLKDEDILVYHRYEGHSLAEAQALFKETSISSIRIASQNALLGAVTNNLRSVSISFIKNKFTLYFYYDRAPSEKEEDLSKQVIEKTIACFEKITGEIKRFVIPEPEKIPLQNDVISVYWRYEEYPFSF